MITKAWLLGLAAAFGLFIGAAAVQAQPVSITITNGDFQTDQAPYRSMWVTPITGWTQSIAYPYSDGDGGPSYNYSGLFNVATNADYTGPQFANITCWGETITLSQTLSTTAQTRGIYSLSGTMGEGWGGNNYGGTYTIQLLAGTTVIASMTGADGIGQTSTLPMMALNADKSAWGIFGQSFNCTSTAIDPSLNGQALSIAFSLTGWTSLGMANLSLTETPTLIPGDINGDGLVDVADYNIWAANVGKTGATWAQGDLNGDGLVDVADYNIWAANVGRTSATPEPISMIILAIGGGLVALKRSSILRPQTQGRNG